jgi:nucleotide-binding universal stress UspA family protein
MIPQIQKILYATDLSENSSYAFLYAVDMANKQNAKIVILHAIEPIPGYARIYTADKDEFTRKHQDEKISSMANYLQEFCRKAQADTGLPCVELVSKIRVTVGHPPEEILNIAEEESCDVIVMGSHGKGFLAHTFLGSVSSAVLHRTRKPVLTIPLPSGNETTQWEAI